ncbi:hypothetical protein [Myxococcus sp. Y35]|uniref:hypothetical protein n=1 Tax=Pseudomyxococcus flavus TaxID=3115648 RepID=UPI003CEBCDB9
MRTSEDQSCYVYIQLPGSMEVGSAQHRRATRQNLLSECGRFRLSKEAATHLIDTMKRIVSTRW